MTGGAGGAGGVEAAALRKVKMPTTTGMTIRMRDTHIAPNPNMSAVVGSLLPSTLISAPGVWLTPAIMTPKKQANRPGQPHKTTLAIVAISAVLRFIFFSFVRSMLLSYTKIPPLAKNL
jgi:hypothetical protein